MVRDPSALRRPPACDRSGRARLGTTSMACVAAVGDQAQACHLLGGTRRVRSASSSAERGWRRPPHALVPQWKAGAARFSGSIRQEHCARRQPVPAFKRNVRLADQHAPSNASSHPGASASRLLEHDLDAVERRRRSFAVVVKVAVASGHSASSGQIRACAANALGSHLGCWTRKRCCGQGCRTLAGGSQRVTISFIRRHGTAAFRLRRTSARRQRRLYPGSHRCSSRPFREHSPQR